MEFFIRESAVRAGIPQAQSEQGGKKNKKNQKKPLTLKLSELLGCQMLQQK